MTAQKRILRKTTLELLHGIDAVGMTPDMLSIYITTETDITLTDQELTDLLNELKQKGWIRSYLNPITNQVRWIITATGEGARAAM